MKKTNNKGFSLVELIIVIAIMAVLIGVLAPQFLRYVERSRLQRDNTGIAEIANSVEIALSNEAVFNQVAFPVTVTITAGAAGTNATITYSATSVTSATGGTTTLLVSELQSTLGDSFTSGSNTYRTSATDIVILVTQNATTGAFSTTLAGDINAVGGTARAAHMLGQ